MQLPQVVPINTKGEIQAEHYPVVLEQAEQLVQA